MNICHFFRIVLVILLFAHIAMVWAEQQDEALVIAQNIADKIALDQPIFLDIRCGEWTPALSTHFNNLLLQRSADIREIYAHTDFSADNQGIVLSDYSLEQALLVQVEMSIKWQNREHKSFFSYRSERNQVNSFTVKQVQLPEQRLIDIYTYDHLVENEQGNSLSTPRFHWFDPLIATAAIASIVFLLWTIE